MDPATREEEGLTGNDRTQRPRSSVPSFLFISFMLFMLTSHNGDEFLARHQYQDTLRSLRYQLSNYTAWMDGTVSNFTVPERDPFIPIITKIYNGESRVLDPSFESYYSNVTGFIHGDAYFHNITLPVLANNESLQWKSPAETFMADSNMTEIINKLGEWNWTASTKVAMSIVEKKPLAAENISISQELALVHGRIELTDDNTSEDFRLEFEGVHFISNGSIYGLAEPSGRHIDIRLLPSLVPEIARNDTAHLIAPELQARVLKLINMIDAGIFDQESSGNDEAPKSTCPFSIYVQIHPSAVPELLMVELENELQIPTGISTVSPPKLAINGILLSKECGILYEINHTEGLRSRTFFRKVTTYAGMSAIVYLLLLILFSRQTERSRTPSGISRVSRWTFLSQATIDSVSFAGHITFAILADGRPSLSLIVPAFLACMLFVQEAQFSGLIHQVQGPENVIPEIQTTTNNSQAPTAPSTQAEPPTAAQNPPISSNNAPTYPPQPAESSVPTRVGDSLATPANESSPTPVVQPSLAPQAPSFFSFLVQHVRTDPQARLWVLLFIFLTLIVRVILSPTLSMVFVTVTYSSIWLPQIARSARRGRSSGLSKEYIVGTTLCRLFNALYFLACPKNVLEIEPRGWSYLLGLFVCLQAFVIILQDYISPSFFLPQKYVAVKVYDYHPPMPLPDSESPEQSLGDCAICMDAILVDPSLHRRSKSFEKNDDWDDRNIAGITLKRERKSVLHSMQMGGNSRKNYSLAPCQHLFHTECLEKWLAIKNICPQCRRPLPPL